MRFSPLLLAAGLTAAVAGCASATAPRPAPSPVEARGVAAIEPAADPRPFGAADTAFGLDVLRAWCAQYPGKNLVFSPSTLASALGMAYAGAHGATAAAMASVLHLPAAGGTNLAAGLQARADALGALGGPGVTLAPSDEVWADPSLPPLTSYLNAVATGYRAGLAKAPFLSDQAKAADEVNAAIAAATRGHIPHLVSPGMLSDVGWVLTSALYMNAKWATPFDPAKTTKDDFTLANGKTVLPFYLEGKGFAYARAAGWTAVDLPYKGGKLTMTALLPPAGSASGSCALPSQAALTSLTAVLRGRGLGASSIQGAASSAEVDLPKVSLSTGGDPGDMKPVLQRLGMGVAFTAQADFTGLSKLAGNLAFVQQAATLQVAEKGTVAAAAAAVGVTPTSAEVNPVTVRFDRPYLMLVTATSTGEPLFLAEVADPTAS
ncbi:serpin family protein [Trebonia kvetii]|nr:serpin family protein [Trebonia kvetii]